MIAVTLVTPAALPELAALHAAAFGAAAWPLAMLADSLAQDNVSGLQLHDGGALVGFLLAQRAGDDCEILTYAVHPARQRRGYGRHLLQALYDLAKAQGRRRILLEVAEDNRPAIKLYSGFGFQASGRRPNYYPRPDGAVAALLMNFDL